MHSGELLFNDGRIAYQLGGDSDDAPIVFIHGFALDHNMWRPQVDAFTKGHSVITYDARGFGQSTPPKGPYNRTEDLTALLEHLCLGPAHIVGLSMGGRTATNYALDHPENVLSLTLMDAALDGYQNTVDWDVRAKQEGLEVAKENWLSHPIFSSAKTQPDVMENLKQIVASYSGWHWLNDDPHVDPDTTARARLAEISAPTLVVVGANDLDYFHNIAEVLAGEIPGAQKVTIPSAGHMVNMEAPQKINQILAQFISSELDLPSQHSVY